MLGRALSRALLSLLHPRILLLMLLPVVAAFVIWLFAAVLFWGEAVAWVDARMNGWETVHWLFAYWPLTLIAAHTAAMAVALLLVPVILVTVLLVTGIFAMPMMVSHVGARDYALLEKRHGGSFAGSVWSSFAGLLWFLALAMVTLPLWLFPPLWPLLSLGLLAYLNQRVLRYDALAEHGDADEIARIVRDDRWALFGLGVIVALVAHVPLLGFFSPVYGALVFIHFALARLQAMRMAPIEGQSRRIHESGNEDDRGLLR